MTDLAPFATGGFEDEAEQHLVRVLEERRARAKPKNVDWDASVEGETPPLGGISAEGIKVFDPVKEEKEVAWTSKKLMKLAKKVITLKSQGKLSDSHGDPLQSIESSTRSARDQSSGRSTTRRSMLEQIHEEESGFIGGGSRRSLPESSYANIGTNRYFRAAMVVDETFQEDDETESVASESAESEATGEELLPLTDTEDTSLNQNKGGWFGCYGTTESAEARRREKDARTKKWRQQRRKFLKSLGKCGCCYGNRMAQLFHPVAFMKSFLRFIFDSWFTRIGLPSLIAACCLFYNGNPTVDFLPQATVSWWLIFICRQTLTLELALITQYVLIDGLALRSKLMVKIFGPLVTLFVINAKGWPFITTGKRPKF